MSAWGDMMRRSSGDEVRKEDIALVYYDNESKKKENVILKEKDYKNYHYRIKTFGCFPILEMDVKSEDTNVFGGYELVILKCPDNKSYELDRQRVENIVRFVYKFNKPEDYIHSDNPHPKSSQDGHMYTVQEVEKYAEMFIDKILDCEKELNKEIRDNISEKINI